MSVRTLFSIDGLDIGKNNRNLTYFYGLSDFWQSVFEDSEKIELLLEAGSQKLSDIYSKFLQLTSTISITDIEIATAQQIKLVLIKDTDSVSGKVNTYTLSETILESRIIANRPLLPTAYLESGVHYQISDDGTEIQFFEPISTIGFATRGLSTGEKEYALWFVDSLVDEEIIYRYYGKLLDVTPQTSTENFKSFIYGLYYLFTNGPNLSLVRKGLNLALGIPLARDTEAVLEIRKYLNTDQFVVITDLNSYLIPYGLSPSVAVGDYLEPTQELAQWVEVKDWISDGDWWINLQIPDKIIPYIPTGETDRYAKVGSYADYVMRNFLKQHTFLVNVKTLDFKNLQSFEQLSDLINQVKPAYTYPIYVWTVPPLADDELELTESMALRWDNPRFENITLPVEKMVRLYVDYGYLSSDRASGFVLSQNNALALNEKLYRSARANIAITGETYWETNVEAIPAGGEVYIGIARSTTDLTVAGGGDANSWVYKNTAFTKNNNVLVAYGATYTVGDVIGINYNSSTGTLIFFKNGVSQGTAYSGISGAVYPFMSMFGGDGNTYVGTGVENNYASATHTTAMAVVGDIDIRCRGQLTNWFRTDTSESGLVCKMSDTRGFLSLSGSSDNGALCTLGYDFTTANINPVAGTGPITFTRSGVTATRVNASGLIEAVAANAPRFDFDPITLQCRGLLIEDSRTNLNLRSEEFDNGTWTKSAALSITPNVTTAPDGTLTADRATPDGTGSSFFNQSVSTVAGSSYCYSIFAKADVGSKIIFEFHGSAWSSAGATYDLSNGTFSGGLASDKIENYGNGWYRCSGTRTAINTGSTGMAVFIDTYPTGLNGHSIYIWGAQQELVGVSGSNPLTSYIKTTSATVTRNADTALITNLPTWFNSSTSTVFVEGSQPNIGFGWPWAIDDGSTSINRMGIYISFSISLKSPTAGIVQAEMANGANLIRDVMFRAASCYKLNDFAHSVNGTTAATDTSGTMPIGQNRLIIGSGDAPLNGHIRKWYYFPTRLSNATIKRISNGEATITPDQFAYMFYVGRGIQAGKPILAWSSTGSDVNTVVSNSALPITEGQVIETRATLDVDDGAGNKVITFYTSQDGETWTTLDTQTIAGITSIWPGTNPLLIGASRSDTRLAKGRIYYAEIRNGINGTVVAKFEPSGLTFSDSTTSFKSATGETWTLNSTGLDHDIALDYNFTKGTLAPQVGNEVVSFVRATTATIIDHESVVRGISSGEARFEGLRRVKNLLLATEGIDAAPWSNITTNDGSNPILVSSTAVAPDGTSTAYRYTFTPGATGSSIRRQSVTGLLNPVFLSPSIWVKSISGSATITTRQGNGGSGLQNITITTSWQRIAATVGSNTGATFNFDVGAASSVGTITVDIWHPQLEDIIGQLNQSPGEYISVGVLSGQFHGANVDGVKYFPVTNANFIVNNIVTEVRGTAIPISSTRQGFLLESARTNLCLQSEDLATTWTTAAATVGSNVIVSPSGYTNADKIQEDSANAVHGIGNGTSIIALNTQYTMSAWLRAGEETIAVFANDNTGTCAFDLAAGTATPSVGTGYIIPFPNSWYRCIWTFTSSGTAATGVFIRLRVNGNFVGTAGNGLYAWGMQVEAAPSASSYIPTTTASVTRNREDASITVTSWFNSVQSTFFVEWIAKQGSVSSSNNRIIGIADPKTFFSYNFNNADQAQLSSWDNANSTNTVTTFSTNTIARGAIGFTQPNSLSLVLNSGAVATGVGANFSTPSTVFLGNDGSLTRSLNGYLRRVTYLPVRLPDAELQSLTSGVPAGPAAAIQLYDKATKIRSNFGKFPFSFPVPTTAKEGVYTDLTPLTRENPLFTRDFASNFTNEQLANSSLVNASALAFEGGIVAGYINSIGNFRTNTREENGWMRAIANRNHPVYRKPRTVMAFTRGESTADGVTINTFNTDDLKRLVFLYTTTQEGVKAKYATMGGGEPGLSTWTWTLFESFRSTGAINSFAINNDFNSRDFTNLLSITYTNFFTPGAYRYLGPFMPPMGYQTYLPAQNQIRTGDYLRFIRVYEKTVAVFWVTSNFDLDIPAIKVATKTDALTIYSNDSPVRYGLGPYSSYYLLRGAGGSLSYGVGGPINAKAVNVNAINGSVSSASSSVDRIYQDDLNTPAIHMNRSGVVLKFRRDFK